VAHDGPLSGPFDERRVGLDRLVSRLRIETN
jgi:hypothetical protein